MPTRASNRPSTPKVIVEFAESETMVVGAVPGVELGVDAALMLVAVWK
jgi:hypothetical protein